MKAFSCIAAAAAFCMSVPATAQELVINGGFETGDFSGWTQGGQSTLSVVCGPSCAQSGSDGALLSTRTTTGTLSQVLTTVPGQTYDISFWLSNNSLDPLLSFDFLWGGTTRLSLGAGSGTFPYSLESFNLIATDTSTQIFFEYRNDTGYWLLDDVSVQATNTNSVPEPATWTLMLLGFGAVGFALRGRRPRELANEAA